MGTRNLTAVFFKGEYRIAQYGQWDGYVSGAGQTVLKFLNSWDRQKFQDNLLKTRLLSDDEAEKVWEEYQYLMTRDNGAKILQLVQDSELEEIPLQNAISFASDSLFCEYAYLIDLDTNQLEVYTGFQTEPHEIGRFAKNEVLDHPIETKYYPIKLQATYSLDKLPSLEAMKLDVEGAEEK